MNILTMLGLLLNRCHCTPVRPLSTMIFHGKSLFTLFRTKCYKISLAVGVSKKNCLHLSEELNTASKELSRVKYCM